jgi:quinol monooxygenase YgiN
MVNRPGHSPRAVLLGASVLAAVLGGKVITFAQQSPVVRLAELHVDPGQLEEYRARLREEIDTSIRLEPGVLTLYAVSIKGEPTHIRIFEMYADSAAYEAHLRAPHFKKYKAGTQSMVKSLVLLEADPIVLGAKPK